MGRRPPTAFGVWTHLVATYNANTSMISLYVNSDLKGTAQHTATPVVAEHRALRGRPLPVPGRAEALLLRDDQQRAGGKRALTPTQIGASNSAKNGSLTPVGATTWTPPGTGQLQTEIYASDVDRNLWNTGSRAWGLAPRLVSTGWNHFTAFGIADWDHHGYQDILARDNVSGAQGLPGHGGRPESHPHLPGDPVRAHYHLFGVGNYNGGRPGHLHRWFDKRPVGLPG